MIKVPGVYSHRKSGRLYYAKRIIINKTIGEHDGAPMVLYCNGTQGIGAEFCRLAEEFEAKFKHHDMSQPHEMNVWVRPEPEDD
jgi:hypothetical protein